MNNGAGSSGAWSKKKIKKINPEATYYGIQTFHISNSSSRTSVYVFYGTYRTVLARRPPTRARPPVRDISVKILICVYPLPATGGGPVDG